MTLKFHNRKLEEITMEQVTDLFENNEVVVDSTYVGDIYWVSTQLMPLAQEPERQFETAIFEVVAGRTERILAAMENATEAEAQKEHDNAVKHLTSFIAHGIDLAGLIDFASGDRPDMPPMPDLTKDTFTCMSCGGTFPKEWTDEEMKTEMREVFGDLPPSEQVLVCDPCYNKVKTRATVAGEWPPNG